MTRSLAWGTALILLLGAAALAGGASQVSPVPARPAAPGDAELARCQTLGETAGVDARCRAAWSRARAKFFGGAVS